jgi:hypothetical protein
VSLDAMLITVAVGTALVAAWTHVRFPALAPRTMGGTGLHLLGSLLLLRLVAVSMTSAPPTAAARLALFVGLGFPALIYLFLAALWTIQLFQRLMSGAMR